MEASSGKLLITVIAAAILSLFAIQVMDYLNFGVDDVFISMRVAENAAHGDGAVFNAGENVEGYSNPLWVAFLTVGVKLGFDQSHSENALLWFAKALSFLFGIGVFMLLYFTAKDFETEKDVSLPPGLIILLVAVSCGPFILWCCGGMETTLTAFLFTLSLFLFQKISRRLTDGSISKSLLIVFSVILALVALTRPEPVLHAIAALIFLIIIFKNRLRNPDILALSLPFVIIFSIFLVWRYVTFGDLVPNTFYAKTGGGLKSYFLSTKYLFGGVFFIGGPFLLSVLFIPRIKFSPLVQYCLLLILVTFVFILYSGGDWMAGYRFFIPVAPAFFLLAARGISALSAKLPSDFIATKNGAWKFAGFIVFLAICSAFAGRILIRGQIPIDPAWSTRTGHSTPWDYIAGAWLRDHAANKTAVVATNEVGLIGYMNPSMRIIDLGGLSDKHIAQHFKHGQRADADYVLDQKPDYIMLPASGEGALAMNGEAVIMARAKPDPLPTLNYSIAIAQSDTFSNNYHLEKKFPSLELYGRNK